MWQKKSRIRSGSQVHAGWRTVSGSQSVGQRTPEISNPVTHWIAYAVATAWGNNNLSGEGPWVGWPRSMDRLLHFWLQSACCDSSSHSMISLSSSPTSPLLGRQCVQSVACWLPFHNAAARCVSRSLLLFLAPMRKDIINSYSMNNELFCSRTWS